MEEIAVQSEPEVDVAEVMSAWTVHGTTFRRKRCGRFSAIGMSSSRT